MIDCVDKYFATYRTHGNVRCMLIVVKGMERVYGSNYRNKVLHLIHHHLGAQSDIVTCVMHGSCSRISNFKSILELYGYCHQ